MIIWTNIMQDAAINKGWGMFENSDHGWRIERHGETFKSDAAAVAHVGNRAANGSALEKQAFAWLARQHADTHNLIVEIAKLKSAIRAILHEVNISGLIQTHPICVQVDNAHALLGDE